MEEYVCPSGRVLLKYGDTFLKATVLLPSHGRGDFSSRLWEESTTAVVGSRHGREELPIA